MVNREEVDTVFINCPFDTDYRKFFDAICFAIQACGFSPRCALEDQDSHQPRVQRIAELVRSSALSIHDLSRVTVPLGGLPRFNMPFELGLFMGFHWDNRAPCLVLDTHPSRYRKAISDIAGQDIQNYGSAIAVLIACVRNFLADRARTRPHSPSHIVRNYLLFKEQLPGVCAELSLVAEELTFADRLFITNRWLDLKH